MQAGLPTLGGRARGAGRRRALIALLAASLPGAACQLVAADRPNIIWIVADDLGYGELGSYGGRDVPTPHIDAIARNGVRFTNGYVTAPFCAAARASLLTGRYQTRFGFEFNPIGAANADPDIGLPVGQRTLADVLRDAGYVTGLVGKWHLGGSAKFNPQRRGFDEFFGFLHEGHYYAPPPWVGHVTWLRRGTLPDGGQGRWTSLDGRTIWSTHLNNSFEPDYDADNPLLRRSQPIGEKQNLTDAFGREAEDFIRRHKAQPFFLYLAYNAVHSPMQGADAYMKKFAPIDDIHRRIFAAMLAHLDDSVGRVLARVRTEGLEDRTLIVFMSDNGGPTRELTSSNRPLRGEKGQLLEGGIRVPMMLQWKGRVPAGGVESRLVSSLDLFPTAAVAAGAKPAADLDGVDLMPHLLQPGPTPIRAQHYWRVGTQAAFRAGEWKIFRGRNDRTWQLYNLAEDISEERDLAAAQPAKLAELQKAWHEWDAKMIEPLWGPTNRRQPDAKRK